MGKSAFIRRFVNSSLRTIFCSVCFSVFLFGSWSEAAAATSVTSDILWDSGTGAPVLWQMTNGTVGNVRYLSAASMPAGWQIGGVGDFNGDGFTDILWTTATPGGPAFLWMMTAYGPVGVTLSKYGQAPGKAWIGDFNGDGKSDILWETGSSAPILWTMDGATVASSKFFGTAMPAGWHIAAVGDFNGDGKTDILWTTTAPGGPAILWLTTPNGPVSASLLQFGRVSGKAWTGDFNGDGKTDILWDNGSSAPVLWTMNGATVTSAKFFGPAMPAGWHIVDVGDFNGDGLTDILWSTTAPGGPAILWTTTPYGPNSVSLAQFGGVPAKAWAGKFSVPQSAQSTVAIAPVVTSVDGQCGSANGQTMSTIPSANLCASGSASSVTGEGPWAWFCAGSGAGVTAQCSASITVASDPEAVWRAEASAQVTSPVIAQSNDTSMNWIAPDGRTVQLTVANPHPLSYAPIVTMAAVPSGTDATPAFKAAIASVKAQKAAELIIPQGTYTFDTLDTTVSGSPAHLLLQDMADMTIEGNNSTFIFTNNALGIFVTRSQRVKVQNITIQYQLHPAGQWAGLVSTATMQMVNGVETLVVDPAYPVTATDGVGHISEYNTTTGMYVLNGLRAYNASEGTSQSLINYVGNQGYTAPTLFNSNMLNKTYLVFHQYYGGAAFEIGDNTLPTTDTAGFTENEDISLNHIIVNSSPGMGIIAYGVKRGVSITNSQITPASGSLASSEYDAMHLLAVGGDALIKNNLISGQGDDGINMNNPISLVVGPGTSGAVIGTTVQLEPYSRFFQPGDTLAFFDRATDTIMGTAHILTTHIVNGLTYQFTMDASIPGLTNTSNAFIARDLNLIDGRNAIINNTVQNCGCHGILVQTPNTLVSSNLFQNTGAGGIEILTNVGSFMEGVGAINVSVTNNTVTNSGLDNSMSLPWSAISLYGGARGGVNTSTFVNSNVQIDGNTVTSPYEEGCITVASAQGVSVTNNRCNLINSTFGTAVNGNKPAITVLQSDTVTLSGNQRTGTTTGAIYIDPTATNVTNQPGF
jgi:hypothetical protein